MADKENMTVVLRQTLAVLPLWFIIFMNGIGIGWVAPMLSQLKNFPESAFTTENCAWIAALPYVSRGITPFASVFMIDRLGRNVLLVMTAFLFFVVWIIVYSSLNIYAHYTARFLLGLGIGFNEITASIYIGENCSPKLRATFSSLQTAAFCLGEMVVFLLAEFLSYEWVAIANSVLGLLTVASTVLLKEPAHYLIMRGDLAKAEKNYHWLHDLRNPTSQYRFADIKQYVLEEKGRRTSSWYDVLRRREVFRSLRVMLLVHFLYFFSGFNAINAFVTTVLSGSTGLSNTQLTAMMGAILFPTVFLSFPFFDRFNRRSLFLTTMATMSLIHAATALLIYTNAIYQIPHYHWILFALLTIYMSLNGMFGYPLLRTLRAELLPQSVKSLGSSLAIIVSSIGAASTTGIFLPFSESVGMYANFLLFSFVSISLFLYIYVDLPETRGRTLTDIQRTLKGGSAGMTMDVAVVDTSTAPTRSSS